MIELNLKAETPGDLFGISAERANEMITAFMEIAAKTADMIHRNVEIAKFGDSVFPFFPMVGAYAALARNEKESFFAIYCASGAVSRLDQLASDLMYQKLLHDSSN